MHNNSFVLKRNIHPAVNKKPYLFYFAMYLFCFLSYYLFTNPDWADVTRSIASAEEMKKEGLSFVDVIVQGWQGQLDFIYPLLKWLFVYKLGTDQIFLLSLILFFFFYTICEVLRRRQIITKGYEILILYILFSCPFILIHGISRNLLAITFLYYGYYYYVEKRIKWSVAFVVLSILTHITIVLFVAVFIASIFLSKRNFKNGIVRIVLLVFLLMSVLFPKLLLGYISLLSQFVADENDHYVYYSWVYTSTTVENLFNTNDLNYGIKIPVFYSFFFAIVMLLMKTRNDISYWMLYISVILFSFFAQCTVTIAERCVMFFPLFIGISVFSFYKEKSIRDKRIVQLLCILGLFTVLIHFYSIRMYFAIP